MADWAWCRPARGPGHSSGPSRTIQLFGAEGSSGATEACPATLWEAWSECSLSCGWRAGVVQRTRAVTFPGLLACPFALAEQESCMPPPCETHAPMRTWSADGGWINGIDCALSSWSNWDACEVSCGGGFTKRTKSVLTPAAGEGTPCSPVCTDRIVLLSGVSVNC